MEQAQQSQSQKHLQEASPKSQPQAAQALTSRTITPSEKSINNDGETQVKDAEKSKEEKKSFLDKLPVWVSGNLRNPRSMKTLIRCWVASWVAFLLLLPTKSLTILGQAAFFTSMVTFMLPANMPVSVWLYANFTLALGALLGWAWSCLGMKLALLARDQVLLARQVQTAQQSVASATNPEAAYQDRIFEGDFLDTTSSVVFGVFLMVGMYFAAVVQAKVPKLKLFTVFFSILAIVMCSYGPLFPFAQYTLGTIFLLPIGCSLGVSFACQIFIFPESLSHEWQGKLCSLLSLSQRLLKSHSDFLSKVESGDLSDLQDFENRIKASHTGIVQSAQALGGQVGFLELEITYGRLSGKDLAFLFGAVKKSCLRIFGLSAFHHFAESIEEQNEEDFQKEKEVEDKVDRHEKMSRRVKLRDTHTLMRARKRNHQAEVDQHVELKNLLPILVSASRPTFQAGEECLTEITSWISSTNSRRWFNQPTKEEHETAVQKLKDAAEKLFNSRKAFIEEERHKLIKPYEKHFGQISPEGIKYLDVEGAKQFRAGARPLFLCLVFASNLNNYASELQNLTEAVQKMASKRPRNRILFPTGIRKIGHILVSKKVKAGESMDFGSQEIEKDNPSTSNSNQSSMYHQDEHEHDEEEESHEEFEDELSGKNSDSKEEKRKAKEEKIRDRNKRKMNRRNALKDADALPPSKWFHHLGRIMASIYHFTWSPTGVFALRQCIGVFALWIMTVLPNTAGFAYHNRGIWAIITVPTTMAVFSGELVFSLVNRVIGILAGLVVGMLLWYISTGTGTGNHYGIAATMAIALFFIVFLRIFAPLTLRMPVMMLAVTTNLIVGYSWIDTHLQVSANSGYGYEVAWRRALLVIVGMAVATIVSLLPRPSSTREVVRKTLAQTNSEILKLYTLIIEAYIVVDKDSVSSSNDLKSETERSTLALTSFRSRYIATQAKMAALQTSLHMASLDLAPRGVWPEEKYRQLHACQVRILGSLAQLYASLLGMSLEWRREFAQNTSILNPATIGDITVGLSLITTSLSTGNPLPHAGTGVLLERVIQREAVISRMRDTLRRGEDGDKNPFSRDNLSLSTLQDPQYMTHVTGTMALMTLLAKIDECSAVVSSLTGELLIPGFDEMKDAFEDRWASVA